MRIPSGSSGPVHVVVAALLALLPTPVRAADPAPDFQTYTCSSCHTIGGGRLTGPDLKNVTQRKDRAWLANFITNPKAAIDSGDPYARQLLKDAGGSMVMPTLGVPRAKIEAILDFIDAESKLPRSRFAGSQFSDRPFTPADITAGKRIFLGQTRLTGGGPACISCHNVTNTGALGGGAFAPDLTKVFERRGGRNGLMAFISTPATPTMPSVFANQPLQMAEVESLVAFLQNQAPSPEQPGINPVFPVLAMVGAIGLLVLLNYLWRGRLVGVRRALVQSSLIKGEL